MTDGFIRHFIAFLATLAALMIYWAAYASGANGWWWTVLGMVFVYVIVYALVEA